MITASEARKNMMTNVSKTYKKEMFDYFIDLIDKEIKKVSSAENPKSNCSFWFEQDLIKDKEIKEKFKYCIENELLDDIIDSIIEELTKSEFIVQKLFNGISIAW